MNSVSVVKWPVSLAIAFALAATGSIAEERNVSSPASRVASYSKIPLSFEANQGQSDPSVQFLSHGEGYLLQLRRGEAEVTLTKKLSPAAKIASPAAPGAQQTIEVHMRLEGANLNAGATEEDPQITKTNYLVGRDQSKWRTGVTNFGKVRYRGVYDGIDLVYYGNQRQLEYDFVVAPGASPRSIRLAFDGETVSRDRDGNLIVAAKTGKLGFEKPVIYQEFAGQRRPVEGSFALLGGSKVGFHIGAYDKSKPLVIDPVLTYVAYLGVPGIAIAIDSSGDAYVTGTASSGIPTTSGAYQTTNDNSNSSTNAFIAKINPAGTALVYATYLGGTGAYEHGVNGAGPLGDGANAIAVDSDGNAYIAGYTYSYDFPSVNYFPTLATGYENFNPNAFVSKLDPTGATLLYSTPFGGSGCGFNTGDIAQGIAVDANHDAFVVGTTCSLDFGATDGAYQTSLQGTFGDVNAFITAVDPTGSNLLYNTYLGQPDAFGYAVAVDSNGSAYVTGVSESSAFPVTSGAYQSRNTCNGGEFVYITKMNPAGSALDYSTQICASGESQGNAIALDSAKNAYVTGTTTSANFPVTTGAFQTLNMAVGGLSNAFVTKLNPAGSALVYSTYLGGSGDLLYPTGYVTLAGDSGNSIAVDGSGNAYVYGLAASLNFPVTPGAYATVNSYDFGTPASQDTVAEFVAKLNPAGSALNYATYLGALNYSPANLLSSPPRGIASDAAGDVYVTGGPSSGNQAASVTELALGTQSNSFFGTRTALTATPNPADVNQTVTLTARVKSAVGSSVPTGTVTFRSLGCSYLCSTGAIDLDPTGTATVPISWTTSPASGIHVYAVYSGDSTHAGGGSEITITLQPHAATPVLSPSTGTYTTQQNVTITDTDKGTIYYTTDGTTPTNSSARYVGAIAVKASEAIKAIFYGAGYTPSLVGSAVYTIKNQAATPVLSLKAGTYSSAQTLTITDADKGTIYYTTDGTPPTNTSTRYTGAISVKTSQTVQAIEYASGDSPSAVASATYTIQ